MSPINLAKPAINPPNRKPRTMKTNQTRRMMKVWSLVTLLMVGTLASQAQNIPAAINYQGRLTDNLGATVTSGYYEIEFRIWDDPTSTAPASFVWGRSFPLHVVNPGLFNILLSNDGGEISSPGTPQFNDLRNAFAGEDRYLGLTIKVDPTGNVSTPTEISPRQQLASAAYAIQAQTANNVRDLGVTTSALANKSITGLKMAPDAVSTTTILDSNVTEAKIADGAVTTAKIATNAVTSEKLNIDDDVYLNDNTLFLTADTTSGLKHDTNFAGFARDGAVLFGAGGGMLGATGGASNRVVLSWSEGAVGIEGRLDAYGTMVNLSSHVGSVGTTPEFTVHADGTMMFYGRRGIADLQVWINGGKDMIFKENAPILGCPFYYKASGTDGKSVTWPIKRGDKFRWNIRYVSTDSSLEPLENYLFFMPLGKNQGDDSVAPN